MDGVEPQTTPPVLFGVPEMLDAAAHGCVEPLPVDGTKGAVTPVLHASNGGSGHGGLTWPQAVVATPSDSKRLDNRECANDVRCIVPESF